MTLLSNFGSLEKILAATQEELAFCPGLGPQKATKLHKVLRQPFKKNDTRKKLNTQQQKVVSSSSQSKEGEDVTEK